VKKVTFDVTTEPSPEERDVFKYFGLCDPFVRN
jgi:hypothetical protein